MVRAQAGLRERKKVATREALHEAALRLAVEQGIERVTVEAIADAAMVSRRTFSNYFSSKEEAFVHGDLERVRRLLELVHDRPVAEGAWTALERALAEFAAVEPDPRLVARRREVSRHPTLLPYQLAVYATVERELAAEVARRLPDDADAPLRSRVIAATFLTALRLAVQQWTERPGESLSAVTGRALSYVPRA